MQDPQFLVNGRPQEKTIYHLYYCGAVILSTCGSSSRRTDRRAANFPILGGHYGGLGQCVGIGVSKDPAKSLLIPTQCRIIFRRGDWENSGKALQEESHAISDMQIQGSQG